MAGCTVGPANPRAGTSPSPGAAASTAGHSTPGVTVSEPIAGWACPTRSPLELADTAIEGEVRTFEELLEVCVASADGTTADDRALGRAAQFGRTGMVDALLDAGADPTWQDASGNAALIWAARYIHTEETFDPELDAAKAAIVERLLDAGAELEQTGEASHTALTIAAVGGFREVTRVLVQRGANVDHQDDFGQTALHSAAVIGDEELARVLLEAGADSSITDLQGETAQDLARRAGHDRIVDLLEAS